MRIIVMVVVDDRGGGVAVIDAVHDWFWVLLACCCCYMLCCWATSNMMLRIMVMLVIWWGEQDKWQEHEHEQSMSMRHDEEHIYLLMLDCIINRGSKRKGKQGGNHNEWQEGGAVISGQWSWLCWDNDAADHGNESAWLLVSLPAQTTTSLLIRLMMECWNRKMIWYKKLNCSCAESCWGTSYNKNTTSTSLQCCSHRQW